VFRRAEAKKQEAVTIKKENEMYWEETIKQARLKAIALAGLGRAKLCPLILMSGTVRQTCSPFVIEMNWQDSSNLGCLDDSTQGQEIGLNEYNKVD
jgi:hypothetical protein